MGILAQLATQHYSNIIPASFFALICIAERHVGLFSEVGKT